MRSQNFYILAVLALGQLPLGLLRKKFRHRRGRKALHVAICVASLMSQVVTAVTSPIIGVGGLILHAAGSRLCVFGITGGISSGKSTLTTFLQRNEFKIIDADVIAREIVAPGKPAYNEMVRCFGKEILLPDGQLNRSRLRDVIFQNEANRKRINQITHMYIFREMLWQLVYSRLVTLRGSVAIVAPLLFESKLLFWVCSPIITVDITKANQMRRLEMRDGGNVSSSILAKAAASQMPLEEKRKRADVVFDNNGSQQELFEQTVNYFREVHGLHLSI